MSTVRYSNPAYPLSEYAKPAEVFQADLAWSVLGRLASGLVIWDQARWRQPHYVSKITDEEIEMLHQDFNPASRCNTSMCFAGMVVDLTGGRWLFDEKEFVTDDWTTQRALSHGSEEFDTVMVPLEWDVEEGNSLEVIQEMVTARRTYWARDNSDDAVTQKLAELLSKHDGDTLVGIPASQYANEILGADLSEAYNVNNGVADIAFYIAQTENESTGEPLLDILKSRCAVIISRMRTTHQRYAELAAHAEDHDDLAHYEDQLREIERQIENLETMIREEEKATERNG